MISDPAAYELWKKTNVTEQKQKGLYAVGIKVSLGNFDSSKARALADLVLNYAGNELRLTLRQDIQLRHIKEDTVALLLSGINGTLDLPNLVITAPRI
ncbi:MAG: hypothetical protein U5K51_12035 [Flavobacteriaceae bacterium]|nr:hypothetical protein [Flavobacteriaceae bacterium]